MSKIRLEDLTLREKIGQTAMIQAPHLMAMDNLEEYLSKNPIGNVWHTCNHSMVATNLTEAPIDHPENSEFYRNWVKKYTKMLKVPPFVALDGPGSRSSTDTPEMANEPVVGAANSDELAYLSGKYRALAARALGANWIWSPVVDIPSRFCAVEIMRACSDDLEKLIRISTQVVKGMQDHGVAASIKHFPGTDQVEYRDGHFAPAYNHSTYEEWWNLQAQSFKRLIENGVCSVMSTHNGFPAIDDRTLPGGNYIPATISKPIIDLLRNDIGFDGLLITDSIDMAALKVAYPNMKDLYVEMINAGHDLILNIPDFDYIDMIEEAIAEGRITMERLDECVRRILDVKEMLGFFDEPEEIVTTPELLKEISDFNRKICEKSMTLECDEIGQIPLDASKIKNVAIVISTHKESITDDMDVMVRAFEKRGIKATKIRRIRNDAEMSKINAENDLIIYAGYIMPHAPMGASAFVGDECANFFYAFTQGIDKSIGVSLGSVYVYYDFYMNMKTFAHIYSPSPESMEAFVDAIFGDIPFAGTNPYLPAGPRMN